MLLAPVKNMDTNLLFWPLQPSLRFCSSITASHTSTFILLQQRVEVQGC